VVFLPPASVAAW